jgi:UDP-GlcNAc:undecaprenyl-phosphate GlcNAc-1-phosphate transferase
MMSPDLAAVASFAVAAVTAYLATPLAIRAASRLQFFDRPAGYKGHERPTPYLGGTAIIIGILAAVLLVRGASSTHWTIVVGAVAIWAIGTLDDRFGLPIWMRMLIETGIAVLLWETGRGWGIFHNGPADLALTIFWVVAVMNAFNLMDNMDGAAASVGAVSAVGAGALALLSGDAALAALSFAVAGACFGFLPWNLARPARIFMGDGGSLLVGLLVARVTMAAVTQNYLGPSGVVVAALLVALVIFDTTLVTVSRSRAGRPLLTGGRDHLTHRLALRLGGPRNVALTLAAAQLIVSGVTIAVAEAGVGWVLLMGVAGIVLALVLIWQLEKPGVQRPAVPETLEVVPPATIIGPVLPSEPGVPVGEEMASAVPLGQPR